MLHTQCCVFFGGRLHNHMWFEQRWCKRCTKIGVGFIVLTCRLLQVCVQRYKSPQLHKWTCELVHGIQCFFPLWMHCRMTECETVCIFMCLLGCFYSCDSVASLLQILGIPSHLLVPCWWHTPCSIRYECSCIFLKTPFYWFSEKRPSNFQQSFPAILLQKGLTK